MDNFSVPKGAKCETFGVLGRRCRNPVEVGLVAEPGGGLVGYVCGDCAEQMTRQMEGQGGRLPALPEMGERT